MEKNVNRIGIVEEITTALKTLLKVGDPSREVDCVVMRGKDGKNFNVSWEAFTQEFLGADGKDILEYDQRSGRAVIDPEMKIVLNNGSYLYRSFDSAEDGGETWSAVSKPTAPEAVAPAFSAEFFLNEASFSKAGPEGEGSIADAIVAEIAKGKGLKGPDAFKEAFGLIDENVTVTKKDGFSLSVPKKLFFQEMEKIAVPKKGESIDALEFEVTGSDFIISMGPKEFGNFVEKCTFVGLEIEKGIHLESLPDHDGICNRGETPEVLRKYIFGGLKLSDDFERQGRIDNESLPFIMSGEMKEILEGANENMKGMSGVEDFLKAVLECFEKPTVNAFKAIEKIKGEFENAEKIPDVFKKDFISAIGLAISALDRRELGNLGKDETIKSKEKMVEFCEEMSELCKKISQDGFDLTDKIEEFGIKAEALREEIKEEQEKAQKMAEKMRKSSEAEKKMPSESGFGKKAEADSAKTEIVAEPVGPDKTKEGEAKPEPKTLEIKKEDAVSPYEKAASKKKKGLMKQREDPISVAKSLLATEIYIHSAKKMMNDEIDEKTIDDFFKSSDDFIERVIKGNGNGNIAFMMRNVIVLSKNKQILDKLGKEYSEAEKNHDTDKMKQVKKLEKQTIESSFAALESLSPSEAWESVIESRKSHALDSKIDKAIEKLPDGKAKEELTEAKKYLEASGKKSRKYTVSNAEKESASVKSFSNRIESMIKREKNDETGMKNKKSLEAMSKALEEYKAVSAKLEERKKALEEYGKSIAKMEESSRQILKEKLAEFDKREAAAEKEIDEKYDAEIKKAKAEGKDTAAIEKAREDEKAKSRKETDEKKEDRSKKAEKDIEALEKGLEERTKNDKKEITEKREKAFEGVKSAFETLSEDSKKEMRYEKLDIAMHELEANLDNEIDAGEAKTLDEQKAANALAKNEAAKKAIECTKSAFAAEINHLIEDPKATAEDKEKLKKALDELKMIDEERDHRDSVEESSKKEAKEETAKYEADKKDLESKKESAKTNGEKAEIQKELDNLDRSHAEALDKIDRDATDQKAEISANISRHLDKANRLCAEVGSDNPELKEKCAEAGKIGEIAVDAHKDNSEDRESYKEKHAEANQKLMNGLEQKFENSKGLGKAAAGFGLFIAKLSNAEARFERFPKDHGFSSDLIDSKLTEKIFGPEKTAKMKEIRDKFGSHAFEQMFLEWLANHFSDSLMEATQNMADEQSDDAVAARAKADAERNKKASENNQSEKPTDAAADNQKDENESPNADDKPTESKQDRPQKDEKTNGKQDNPPAVESRSDSPKNQDSGKNPDKTESSPDSKTESGKGGKGGWPI
jgi:hypothetical protein